MAFFSKELSSNTSYSGADMLVTLTLNSSSKTKQVVRVLGELQTLSYSLHMERGSVRHLGNINAIDFTNGPRTIAGSLVFAVFDRHVIREVIGLMGVKEKMLPDEMPPFDITITFANEYGSKSTLRIYGVRLVNEGKVLSINDVFIENTYQYVARDIELLTPEEDELKKDLTPESNSKPDNVQLVSSIIKDIFYFNDALLELKIPYLNYSISNNKVVFDITNKKALMQLTIKNSDTLQVKTYSLKDTQLPFAVTLDYGKYSASILEGNTVFFELIEPGLKQLLVTHKLASSIKGKILDDRIKTISYIKTGTNSEQKINVSGETFSITELEPNTLYELYASNEKFQTPKTQVQTSSLYDFNLDAFKFFMTHNNKWSTKNDELLNQAKLLNVPLLPAFYDLYKNNKINTELMHFVSYYDACTKEKSSNIVFENKWLCLYRPPKLYTKFEIKSDQNKIFSNSEQANGLLNYFVTDDVTYRTYFDTFKPSYDYMNVVASNYYKNALMQRQQREAYNSKYANKELINEVYGYYDANLLSNGAYISVDGNKIKGNGDFDTIVIKEDFSLDIAFKLKNENFILENQPFYSPLRTYFIYLEKQNTPCSKMIVVSKIVNGIIFPNQSLLINSYKTSLPTQNLIQSAIKENKNLLETFLLVFLMFINECKSFQNNANRSQRLQEILKAFDKTLFSFDKGPCLTHKLTKDMVIFDEKASLLYFNLNGELVEKTYSNTIEHQGSGFIIHFTKQNQAGVVFIREEQI